MSNLARQQMYFGRLFTTEEILASLEKVTVRRRCNVSPKNSSRPEKIAATVLGPLGRFRLRRDLLAC